MVKLFGVVPGASVPDEVLRMMRDPSREAEVHLSKDLVEMLYQFPEGSRIGIQEFKEGDWAEIREKLRGSPIQIEGKNDYWEDIIRICEGRDYEVVFLDDKDSFLKHAEELKKVVQHDFISREHLFKREGESDEIYQRKLITFNENGYRANIRARSVTDIERDKIILQNIHNNNLDAAMIAIGYTNHWVFEEEHFPVEDYFEEYLKGVDHTFRGIFIENPEGRPDLIWERKGLERAVKLINEGRLTDEKPNYVGIWGEVTMSHPSKGYFEVFVSQRKDDGSIAGTIEDTLGTAIFIGKELEGGIMFTKTYTQGGNGVPKKGVNYKLMGVHNGFSGACLIENEGYKSFRPVFMVEGEKAKPRDLAMMSYEHEQEEIIGKVVSDLKKYD